MAEFMRLICHAFRPPACPTRRVRRAHRALILLLCLCTFTAHVCAQDLGVEPLRELTFLKGKPFRVIVPIGPELQPLPLPDKEALRKEIEPTVPKKRSWIRYIGYPIVGFPRDVAASVVDFAQYPAAIAGACASLPMLPVAFPGRDKDLERFNFCCNVTLFVSTFPFGLVSGLVLRSGSGDPPGWYFYVRSRGRVEWIAPYFGGRRNTDFVSQEHFLFPHLNTWKFKSIDERTIGRRVEQQYGELRAKVSTQNEDRAAKRAEMEKRNLDAEAWNRPVRQDIALINDRIRQHNIATKQRVEQLRREGSIPIARFQQLISAYNTRVAAFNGAAAHGELEPFPRLSIQPPNLYPDAVRLEDDGDQRLMGGESATLHFDLHNAGPGDAYDVQIKPTFDYDKVTVQPTRVGFLGTGQKKAVEVAIAADSYVKDGTLNLRLDLSDFEHLGRPLVTQIPVVHKPLPKLRIAGVEIADGKSGFADGNGNGTVENGESIQLSVRVVNEGEGHADAVRVALEDCDKDLTLTCADASLGRVAAGETREALLGLRLPRTYTADGIALSLRVSEQHGFGETAKRFSYPVTHRQPKFTVTKKLVDGSPNVPGYMDGQLQVGETAELQVQLQNVADIDAEGVEVALEVKDKDAPVLVARCRAGKVPAGRQSPRLSLSWQVSRRFKPKEVRVALRVTQEDFPEEVHELSFPVSPEKVGVVAIGPKPGEAGKRQNMPPMIVISSPRDGARVEDPNVRVTGSAADDTGLVRLALQVDGADVTELAQKGVGGVTATAQVRNRVDIDQVVTLLPGERTILVRAVDTDGAEEVRRVRVTYSPRAGTLWLVAIGIDEYSDPRLRLHYAAKDAQAVHDFYVNHTPAGYKRVASKVLLNANATKQAVERALTTFLRSADKDDTILIYFSGHGGPEAGRPADVYLWPVNVSLDDMYPTAVQMAQVKSLVNQRYRAGRVVLIADACHAGGIGESYVKGPGDTRAIAACLRSLASASGRLVFSASEGAELSREDPSLGGGHGVFTHFLLEALRGKGDSNGDSLVTAREAYDYVYTKVKEHTSGQQHPRIDGAGDFGNIPLASRGSE